MSLVFNYEHQYLKTYGTILFLHSLSSILNLLALLVADAPYSLGYLAMGHRDSCKPIRLPRGKLLERFLTFI